MMTMIDAEQLSRRGNHNIDNVAWSLFLSWRLIYRQYQSLVR